MRCARSRPSWSISPTTCCSATCATLVALNRTEQQTGHFQRALNNGVKKEELLELITHLAFYSGWPTAMSAANVAKKVFEGEQK